MALKGETSFANQTLEDSNLIVYQKEPRMILNLFLHSNALPLIIASSTQRCHIVSAWPARRVHACQSRACELFTP